MSCEVCYDAEFCVVCRACYEKLLDAAGKLYDYQNGPPLIKYEQQWTDAYESLGKILKEKLV